VVCKEETKAPLARGEPRSSGQTSFSEELIPSMGPIARRQLIALRDSSSNLNAKRTWNGYTGRTGLLRHRSGFGAQEAARPGIVERFPVSVRSSSLDVGCLVNDCDLPNSRRQFLHRRCC